MKDLFISPEKITLRNYQREPIFRLIGFVFLVAGLFQIPILLFAAITWKGHQTENDRRSQLLTAGNGLQAKLASLKETRQKLSQIQQWEPIIRSRLPCSALLATIEQALPRDAVLEKIVIEPNHFQVVPVAGGTYRVPEIYSVSIQGSLRFGRREVLETFSAALKKRLGFQTIRSNLLDPVDDLIPFVLVLQIAPTGNYSALGAKRIADPDRL